MGHCLQIQGVDQLVDTGMARKVRLVAKNQKRYAFHGWLLHQNMELLLCDWQSFLVSGVYDEAVRRQ